MDEHEQPLMGGIVITAEAEVIPGPNPDDDRPTDPTEPEEDR